MPYRYTVDINPEESIDVKDIDDQVTRVVNPLVLAFEGSTDLARTFRSFMASMLKQFLGTHKSIRLLMKNREENPAAMADAMSLAREQIEKVYVVALVMEDPQAWTMCYLKDDWRKSYEKHLLDVDERSGLERFKEFLAQEADSLESEQQQLEITEEEKEFVEFKYRNPGKQTPAHLKGAKKTIAEFPTPSEVILKVSDIKLKETLHRWYREYRYFSGYTHSGFSKLMPSFMVDSMRLTTSDKEKVLNTEYSQSVWISYLATAIACTEAGCRDLQRADGAMRKVASVNLLITLTDLWDLMQRGALLGKALYEMRAQDLLPPMVGAAL